ncbi:hypothetical protein [Natronorubrum halophilum]|uniref:hypothetical protein n=1 Tax=Natronorubrum halophilum TaxID=1702106 RepID=UPI000EF727D0|nr:hypothetical protein [Natronorubrum halophilum]
MSGESSQQGNREYTDVREIHPDYYEQECWNCGYSALRKRSFQTCPKCFMGQEQHEDRDSEIYTDEGYIDYRLLWYGDVSMEEAHRRYGETQEDVWKNMNPPHVDKRTVRI